MDQLIHKSSVVYLAVIMLIRMMAMPITLLDYAVNQRFIADHLCENKMDAALHCGGQCFLKKQLARTNDNTESQSQKGGVKTVILDFFEPLNEPAFACPASPVAVTNVFRIPAIRTRYAGDIFHPPIVQA